MLRVGVSLSIGTLPLENQVKEILAILKNAHVDGFVVLAGHVVLDPIGSRAALQLASVQPTKVFTALATEGTWSAGYLLGMQTACKQKADIVISMDADGSHDPADIKRFIAYFDSADVVMSSRFMPNGQNSYPLQRKLLSYFGTLLTRIFLTNTRLTDYTSGYEAIRSSVITKMLNKYPPEMWVSVKHGPYHLQTTELRLAVSDLGYRIREIPIIYGKNRKGKTFNIRFLLDVALGFIELVKARKYMRKVLHKGAQ